MELQCSFEVVYGFNYVPCKSGNRRPARRELRSCLKKSEIWFLVCVFLYQAKSYDQGDLHFVATISFLS